VCAASQASTLAGNRLDEEILRVVEADLAAKGGVLRPRYSFRKKARATLRGS
jgi:hypothetical protein